MLFELICLLYIMPSINCSLVIDSGHQQGINFNNYCPAMKYCPEGSHTMCVHYNPNQVFGPRCSNPLNLSMTPDLADKLLDVANAIRSKIARGKEKGKGGWLLPRGYGIFRLVPTNFFYDTGQMTVDRCPDPIKKWDSELATFAQVLANQCVLRHDICRATERFPDPGQTAGLFRFTYPHWMSLSKSVNFTKPGLYDSKLQFAAIQMFKMWYVQKNFVTKEIVVSCPDFNKNSKKDDYRLYLRMIYGPATHMGCGISAYTEYSYYDNKADLNFNSIQIICNFSARPHKGAPVYNTVPPSDTVDIPETNCGCPVGSYSDSDCLCNYGSEDTHIVKKSCTGAACEPTVVLLPIFTTEDTSPDRIYDSLANVSKSLQNSSEMKEIFDILPDNNKYLRYQNKNKLMNTQKRFSVVHNPQSNYITSVKNRYFGKKYDPESSEDRYRQSHRLTEKHVPKKTSSIFTRVTRFVLPKKHSNTRDFNYNTIRRDVVPRKDFSDAKKLVNKLIYGNDNLYKSNIDTRPIYEDTSDSHRSRYEVFKHSKEDMLDLKDISHHKTEATLNQAEQSIIHHNEYENDLPKESNYREPIETVTLQSDNKLMSLLDTLEKEVKHIELHDKEKEIFDKKIRKIYGKIVGKPVESLKHESVIIKPIKKHNSQSKPSHSVFNVEDILEKHENNKHHKSLEMYDEPTTIEEHRQNKLRNEYLNDDERKGYRIKTNYRDIEHNELNSQEHKYHDFDINIYRKNPFKDHYRHTQSRLENTEDHRTMHKDYFMNNDQERDPLSMDRRKYYQEKLDNIERRLNRARNHKRHRVPEERHMRAMLPQFPRKSDNHVEPFYVADRARFLHSY